MNKPKTVAAFSPPPPRRPMRAAFGASGWGWDYGGGKPGTTGDLFIGKTKAPETGGWVYGIQPVTRTKPPVRRA